MLGSVGLYVQNGNKRKLDGSWRLGLVELESVVRGWGFRRHGFGPGRILRTLTKAAATRSLWFKS